MSLKILVVEDDAIQRLQTVDALGAFGHFVDDVETADDAVKIIEAGWSGEVVVTDVHMPGGLNGFQLAQTICERWPTIGVVIMSGLLRPDRGDLPDDSRFIAKPYDSDRLAGLVEEVAARHAEN